MHDEEAGKADSRIDLNRARHAASGDCQPTRLASPAGNQELPYRTEAAAELPRRVRLQHAGRQPAGRRQHQPSCRHARGKGRHADCGSEEHEQLPRGGRAWPTKPSGSGTCGETGQRIGDVPKQTRGWDEEAQITRAPAVKGRVGDSPSPIGPGAGDDRGRRDRSNSPIAR